MDDADPPPPDALDPDALDTGHHTATLFISRAMARTRAADRLALLIGFLNGAGAGLTVILGPRAAAEQAYALADHLATRVQ